MNNTENPDEELSVMLNGKRILLDSKEGRALLTDAARRAEGIFPYPEFNRKYNLVDTTCAALLASEPFATAVSARLEDRKWSGVAAREVGIFYAPAAAHRLGRMIDSPIEQSSHVLAAAKEIRSIGDVPKSGSGVSQQEHNGIAIRTVLGAKLFLVPDTTPDGWTPDLPASDPPTTPDPPAVPPWYSDGDDEEAL